MITDLTRVLLPVLVAGAEEGVSDGLLVAGGVEHLLAAEVINHGHRDLVQDIGHSASCKKNVQISFFFLTVIVHQIQIM